MQEMSNEDKLIYAILQNDEFKKSNDKAIKEFISITTGIDIPEMPITIETISRKIRLLKSMYPELRGNEDIKAIKQDQEDKYKEMALDKNKPIKPVQESLLEGLWQ